jgi:23S rRNA (cytidine1920-2'-O)/16S rRNA (cytidine1409-2'-O)-methyltransferase
LLIVVKTKALINLLCSRDSRISRKEIYARILCGEVFVDGQRVRDPQQLIPLTARIDYQPQRQYVSRGGEKLAGALQRWKIDVSGMSFLDAGASTGGFTDCLLQHGAARVCSIEVGRNQLDYRLRRDDRVVVLEKTNIMSVYPATVPFVPQAAVADLSLRSLRKAAAHLLSLVSLGWLIALVKPQYEWAAPPAEFDGVVSKTAELHSILFTLLQNLHTEGAYTDKVIASTLPGRRGNREFFCLLTTDREVACGDLGQMIEDALMKAV